MLSIVTSLSPKSKIRILRAVREDHKTFSMIKREESINIVGIYDDDICGGALLLPANSPVYLFCFFENPKYCTDTYYKELQNAITLSLPTIMFFDIYLINSF